jgi:hypothetical protein
MSATSLHTKERRIVQTVHGVSTGSLTLMSKKQSDLRRWRTSERSKMRKEVSSICAWVVLYPRLPYLQLLFIAVSLYFPGI